MWETWVRSLGWEDLLEEGITTHSSIPAWGIPMDRGAWQTTVYGVAKSWTWLSDWAQYFLSPVLQDHFTVQEHILLHFPCSEKVFAVFPLAVETKSTFWSVAFKAFTFFLHLPWVQATQDFWFCFWSCHTFLYLYMENEMAAHSSILTWRILWTEEPGGLLSIGSCRVGHDWSYLACMHALYCILKNIHC